MHDKTCSVLFIGTGNPARSVMAEGLMNEPGSGRFIAFASLHRMALQKEIKDIGSR